MRIALLIVRKVFSASVHGMPIASPKSVVTGHGIDTEMFQPGNARRDPLLVISVGRFTKAKRLDVILRCFGVLAPDMQLILIGRSLTQTDELLEEELRKAIKLPPFQRRVELRSLPPREVIGYLQEAGLFLHASATALDKALLEAMACGCPIVSCAVAAKGLLPETCVASPEDFARKAKAMTEMSEDERERLGRQLREIVIREHSLPRLVERLAAEMA